MKVEIIDVKQAQSEKKVFYRNLYLSHTSDDASTGMRHDSIEEAKRYTFAHKSRKCIAILKFTEE